MTSMLYPGELVIGDDTPDHAHTDPTRGRGFAPGGFGRSGYAGVADPFPDALLVPRSEWQDRIAEMEANKSRLSDLILQGNLPCKDQERTNYCWINAVTHTVEIVRELQNEPQVILSPASAGAQITNYRNEGGWGPDAIAWVTEHGLVPVANWPANAIDRRYATAENKALALKYRDTAFWSIDTSSMDQLVSALLRRLPVAVGYNWWSHEVTAVDAVWVNGAVGVRIRNSWGMDWPTQGAGGFSILTGRKMQPADAVAPRIALPS